MAESGSASVQFAALVTPHLETLFRMAYRLVRNTPDAQDLVQDTCVTACSRKGEMTAAELSLPWLLSVMNNRFIDGQRRRNRSPIVPAEETEDFDQLPSDDFDPQELVQQFEDEGALERAFLQLNETQRTLLSLRAEGYELPEIETITGIDRKVLSARLNRARVSLSLRLEENKRQAMSGRRAGGQS